MKEHYKMGIGFIAVILIITVIATMGISISQKPKILILPEEICQATKGDHMQYYEKNDTIYLEYNLARKPELQPEKRGQQVIVGGDIDYKQDSTMIKDDQKETALKIAENKDSD